MTDEVGQQWMFDLALTEADLDLECNEKVNSIRYARQLIVLIALNLLIAGYFWSRLSSPAFLAVSLPSLRIASLLLIPPIVSLFFYSQLMRYHYRNQLALRAQRTKLSAAKHAYETYAQVQSIGKGSEEKSQDAWKRNEIALEQMQEGQKAELELLSQELGLMREHNRMSMLDTLEIASKFTSDLPEAVTVEAVRAMLGRLAAWGVRPRSAASASPNHESSPADSDSLQDWD
jgi:hypothetical protein